MRISDGSSDVCSADLVFQVETAITIDDKGRLAIPTGYRDVVARDCGNHLVLTYNPFESGCLYLYPLPVWEGVRDGVNKLPRTKKNSRLLQLKLVGAATFVEPDGSGRISIPASQRNAVGIEKKAVLVAWTTSSSCGARRRNSRRSGRRWEMQ